MARPETPEQAAAFEAWYAGDRTFATIGNNLQQNRSTILRWADRYAWYERAAVRDKQARESADLSAAERTTALLIAQQRIGELMRKRGEEYLLTHKITNVRDAILAIKVGIELERQALGIPDYIFRILGATDAELNLMIADMEKRRNAPLTVNVVRTEKPIGPAINDFDGTEIATSQTIH